MCFFPVGRKLFCDCNDIMLPLTGCYKYKSLKKGRAHEVQYSLSAVEVQIPIHMHVQKSKE